MLKAFADWLEASSFSGYLRDTLWIIPVSQSIHIFCVAVVFTSGAIMSLRLLGIGRAGRTVADLVAVTVPWMYCGLVVLIMTGLVQTIAEPRRQFSAIAFWLKMAMIVLVSTMTIAFARAVRRKYADWDESTVRTAADRIFALVSLALWIAIIVCGRFIAYTYTDFET